MTPVRAVLILLALGFVAAVGIPALMKSRMQSPEAGAIGDLRSVSSAQVAYALSNGGAYGRLACLAAPANCGFPSGTAPFLDSGIASLEPKHGYARSFLAGPPASGKPDPGIKGFVLVATPVRVTERARRGFGVDHTGLMCVTPDGSPPPILNGALAPTCTPLK